MPVLYLLALSSLACLTLSLCLSLSLSLSGWVRRALASSPAMGCTEKQRPASAVGAKTARPCDGCLRRRARWFCEADDAFLCQACDVSVHSANPLARRHHRVRLKTASFSGFLSTTEDGLGDHATPAWLHGCKRKPRTPRGKPGVAGAPAAAKVEPLVPDLEALSAEENQVNEEDQLLHCVPILDPVLAELLSQPHHGHANGSDTEAKPAVQLLEQAHVSAVPTADGLGGFHTSDLELEQFASDMEVLLGSGLDNDSFCIDGLGWMNGTVEDDNDGQVKVEVDLDVAGMSSDFRMEMDLPKEALDLGFDSQMMAVEVDEHKPLQQAETDSDSYREEAAAKRKMILRLDYEAVIAACSSNVLSLWMDGVRPDFDPNDSWPDIPAMAGGVAAMKEMHYQQEVAHAADEGREARVSRYREKRRRRLFSKKIRYEVRKLNAEKRPRMKGRFVKRPAFPAALACR